MQSIGDSLAHIKRHTRAHRPTPVPLPLVALVAQRDALIRSLAGEPDAAEREALRGQLTTVLAELDRRYGR